MAIGVHGKPMDIAQKHVEEGRFAENELVAIHLHLRVEDIVKDLLTIHRTVIHLPVLVGTLFLLTTFLPLGLIFLILTYETSFF